MWLLILSLVSVENLGITAEPGPVMDLGPYFPNPLIISTNNKSRCLGPLGCFKIEAPFYDKYKRQITDLPFDRGQLDTKFRLFTNKNPKEYDEIWAEKIQELKSSNFNPNIKTKIIVPGFIDDVESDHWIKMKDELLRKDKFNIVLVDWGRANQLPYSQAVSNARAVGAEIALLVNSLKNNTMANAKDFHLIGHSLGAHVCGYAGERIISLGRITGLDPAGLYFAESPKEVSLDKTDANFVDVIHTNSGETIVTGLGINEQIGHVDFIANNGKNQPGCEGNTWGICDHERALHLFTETISNQGCQMVASRCDNYHSYSRGRCGDCGESGDKCLVAGLDAEDYWNKTEMNKVYYFLTGPTKLYCQFQYRLVIKTGTIDGWLTKGRATVEITGTYSTLESKLGRDLQLFAAAKRYAYLLSSQSDLGPVQSILFHWEGNHYKSAGINETKATEEAAIYIEYLNISPILINQGEMKLCPDVHGPIKSSISVKFNQCN